MTNPITISEKDTKKLRPATKSQRTMTMGGQMMKRQPALPKSHQLMTLVSGSSRR
jgi:hypothetical protein